MMNEKARLTDFFIIGAPRCGTTAMSSYLAQHRGVNFSEPKEPLFFCSDLPGVQSARDLFDYENNFFPKVQNQGHSIQLRGEGSVWYLFSESAIPNVLDYNPDARFIVMLRNPVDMLLSLHQKLYLFLDENEPDFQQAWALQELRLGGENIPDSCREPKLLSYRSIGKLGDQVQRLLQLVRHSHLHFIVYDDFANDQREAYEKVIHFLGLDDDGRQEFSRVNANRKVTNRRLYELLSKPSPSLLSLVEAGKRVLGINKIGLLPALREKLTPERRRSPIEPSFRKHLCEEFSADVYLLSELLGRDLNHWVDS